MFNRIIIIIFVPSMLIHKLDKQPYNVMLWQVQKPVNTIFNGPLYGLVSS